MVFLCLLLSPSLNSSRIIWAVGFFSFLATMSNSWRNSPGRYIWVLCIHLMYTIHSSRSRLFEGDYPLIASRKSIIQNHAYTDFWLMVIILVCFFAIAIGVSLFVLFCWNGLRRSLNEAFKKFFARNLSKFI